MAGVIQRMMWSEPDSDGSRSATMEISVAGLPVHVDAVARLSPTAAGSAIDYSGSLTVKVPLIGAMIEKQAVPFILETLDIQQRTGIAWLERR